ncbi:MAG TPA: hypothetical protein VKR82_17455 [Candidatus Acidoferrales bacterium]|nr:hypothetical protein [Candidatus Acidoferrales bacterium]
MSEQPHLKIKELIAQSGLAVLNQPDSLESWIHQACPQSAWEISLLMAALRNGVPAALLNRNPLYPPQTLRAEMIQRVQTSAGLAPDAAAWGVDAWAYILGVNLNPAPAQQAVAYQQPVQQVNIPPQGYGQPQAQPYAQAQPAAQVQLNLPDVPGRVCPYCGVAAPGQICANCRRDTTARRRICSKCGRFTPSAEPACMSCGKRYTSDLAWKIPVIIVMFIVVLIISIAYFANQ